MLLQLCPSCEGHVLAELLTPLAPEVLVPETWDKPGICEGGRSCVHPLQGSVHLGLTAAWLYSSSYTFSWAQQFQLLGFPALPRSEL